MHYYCNLSYEPSGKVIGGSYSVGARIDYDEASDIDWIVDSHSSSDSAVQSVVQVFNTTIKPWFESKEGVKDILIELLISEETDDLSQLKIAMILAKLNFYVEMKRYAGPIVRNESSDYCDTAYQLIKSSRTGVLCEFLAEFESRNLASLKL